MWLLHRQRIFPTISVCIGTPFSLFLLFCFSKGGQPCAGGGGGLCGNPNYKISGFLKREHVVHSRWSIYICMYIAWGFGHCRQTSFLLLNTECCGDLVEAPVATEMCTKEWPCRLVFLLRSHSAEQCRFTSSLIINDTTTSPWCRRAKSVAWSIRLINKHEYDSKGKIGEKSA